MSGIRPGGLARVYLNCLVELLRKHPPSKALFLFSQQVDGSVLDVVASNVVRVVASPLNRDSPGLFSRIAGVKKQLDACFSGLESFAGARLRKRTIVVHPLNCLGVFAGSQARQLRFFCSEKEVVNSFSQSKLAFFDPLVIQDALDRADLVLLVPDAVVPEGVVCKKGGRLLVELAQARGVPVYGVATSWHVALSWDGDEMVPGGRLAGVISEHGIYSHSQFLARVRKTFPELLG